MRNPKPLVALMISAACGFSPAIAEQQAASTAGTGNQPSSQQGQAGSVNLAQGSGATTPTFTMPGTQPIDNKVFNAGLIITTTESIDGFRIKEYRGIVRGAMVREPTAVQSFKAGFQGMFGGKVHAYITMCEQGRQQAYDAMVQRAQAMGANAVVGMRYDSDAFSGGNNDFGTEVVCYGTAVVIEPKAP